MGEKAKEELLEGGFLRGGGGGGGSEYKYLSRSTGSNRAGGVLFAL